MKVKRNNKHFKKSKQTKFNFFVGDFKGELKKLRGFYNRAIRNNNIPENIDIHVSRQICSPIPKDQESQVARARGEKYEKAMYNPYYNVRVA